MERIPGRPPRGDPIELVLPIALASAGIGAGVIYLGDRHGAATAGLFVVLAVLMALTAVRTIDTVFRPSKADDASASRPAWETHHRRYLTIAALTLVVPMFFQHGWDALGIAFLAMPPLAWAWHRLRLHRNE